MELIFRAYTKNTTTALGVLTEATDKRVSVHYNGPGTGSFRINRNSSQVAWCAPGNYVRVYIDSIATTPVFAFFIETGRDDVLSRDEEGGEVYQRGGRGLLAYLERAIIDNSSAAGRYRRDDTLWRWTDPTHGRIVKELIDDAQLRGVLPLLTYDFTNTTESGGGTWTAIDGDYELPVGLDLLQALERQQSAGLIATMSPSFVLSCSEVIGADLSATVVFEAGVNISEEVTRDVLASAAKSRMLVQGTTRAGIPLFRWVADAATETALGDRREGFVPYQATTDAPALDRVGLQAIRRLKRRHDGLSVLGVLTDVLVPFTDYEPGDTVTVDVPDVWESLEAPITAIVLFDAADGTADCALEFEDIAFEPLSLRDRTEGSTGTGGTGGSGGSGKGEGGGGGAGKDGPCCPPPEPWTFDWDVTAGVFYDYFPRTNPNPGWGTPSSSGHAITAGYYGEPGFGALAFGYPAGAGAATYTTTGVADFTNGRWRLEMDFSVAPYDAPAFVGDTNDDPVNAGIDETGVGFLFTNCADLLMCVIYEDGDYLLRAGGLTVAGNFAGLTLAANTSYTLIWTSDATAGLSRLEIGVYSAELPAGPLVDTRDLMALMSLGPTSPGNWAIAHVTRIQSFTLVGTLAPTTGQPVLGEIIGTGDGTTTTFTTDWPYQRGSLVPKVNGVNVRDEVASYDPSSGDFTFTTAPQIGSEITGDYQAAG